MDFSQVVFDPKYFTKPGLKMICHLSKISDYTKCEIMTVTEKRKFFPKKVNHYESQHPNRPTFTPHGLKKLERINEDYLYDDGTRKYYEYALSLFVGPVRYQELFDELFNIKYFTVEGLKLYCELLKIDTENLVTRNDFCDKILEE